MCTLRSLTSSTCVLHQRCRRLTSVPLVNSPKLDCVHPKTHQIALARPLLASSSQDSTYSSRSLCLRYWKIFNINAESILR